MEYGYCKYCRKNTRVVYDFKKTAKEVRRESFRMSDWAPIEGGSRD